MIGLDLLDISVVACEKLEFGIIVVNYLSCLKVAIFLSEWMWESWHLHITSVQQKLDILWNA